MKQTVEMQINPDPAKLKSLIEINRKSGRGPVGPRPDGLADNGVHMADVMSILSASVQERLGGTVPSKTEYVRGGPELYPGQLDRGPTPTRNLQAHWSRTSPAFARKVKYQSGNTVEY